MTSTLDEIPRSGTRFCARHDRTSSKHGGRQKGIIVRAQQQRRTTNRRQEPQRAGAPIVVARVRESVDRRRHGVVEVEQACAPARARSHRTIRDRARACMRAFARRVRRKCFVYTRANPCSMNRAPRSRSNGTDTAAAPRTSLRELDPALAEPLQQHVAAERKAREHRAAGSGCSRTSRRTTTVEIRRLAGVIQPTRARHLAVARPKDQSIGGPAALVCKREQSRARNAIGSCPPARGAGAVGRHAIAPAPRARGDATRPRRRRAITQRSTRVSSGGGRRTSFPHRVRRCAPGTHHAGV